MSNIAQYIIYTIQYEQHCAIYNIYNIYKHVLSTIISYRISFNTYDSKFALSNVEVVVVVVYLTTNQRHLGYLSSGNGHLAGRYSTP